MEMHYNLNELELVASKILNAIQSKTILFYGEMGTGKTTLIKELAKQLGVKEKVASPTFSLVNEYQGKDHLIYHFDFYRIEDEEEAYDIGFEEYLYSKHWKFIEWPSKIPSLLPQQYNSIKINYISTDRRKLTLSHK